MSFRRAAATVVAVVSVAVACVFAGDGAVSPALAADSPFSPGAWDLVFGFVPVGTTSTPERVTVRNTGKRPMTFDSITLDGLNAGDFVIWGDTCLGRTLGVSKRCHVGIAFRPTEVGTRVASLRFTDTSACSRWVHLAGSAITASASRVPAPSGCAGESSDHVGTKKARRCVNGRQLVWRVRDSRPGIKRIRATLDGKRQPVFHGHRLKVLVDLRGVSRRARIFRLMITTASGRVVVHTHRIRRCGRPS